MMYRGNAVPLLTISPIDIIDNLDDEDHNLSEEQKERILKLYKNSLDNDDVIYDAICDAIKHVDLSDYYRDAIEDTIDILKEKCNATT